MYDCMTKVSTDSYPTEKAFKGKYAKFLKTAATQGKSFLNSIFAVFRLIEPIDILYQKAGFQLVDKVNT